MTDIKSTVQITLQEAGYKTWLAFVDQFTAVCFEDDAIMGFVSIFDESRLLLDHWRDVESVFLARHSPRLREAEDKAWNVYSIFLCPASASDDDARQIRSIGEDLELTRKIAACDLVGQEEIVEALLPILPIQYSPRLASEDLTARLKKRKERLPRLPSMLFSTKQFRHLRWFACLDCQHEAGVRGTFWFSRIP
jgi:hypothetical protein